MVWLKSLVGLVIGAIGGALIGLPIGVAGLIIIGIVTWNNKTGQQGANVVYLLSILFCAIYGFVRPIKDEAIRKSKLAEEERQSQQTRKDAETRRQQEERRQQEQREAEVRRQFEYLSGLLSSSRRDFDDLRKLVSTAERCLDRAEEEFTEGAFSPFWDEIEHATNMLASYQHNIDRINHNAIEYQRESVKLTTSVPPFDLPIREMPDGRPTASRLAAIVRKTQTNFQFASIYEQRKTNRILVDGFGTLASAIYAVGNSITCSLDDLSTNLHTSLSDLLEETRENSRQVQSAADRYVETLADQSNQAAAEATIRRQFERDIVKNQEKQVKMLDNIQRG